MNLNDEKLTKQWIAVAPVIFLLHFLEEVPGFVKWANSYVDQDISQGFFLSINFFVLGITSVVAAIMWVSPSSLSASISTLWLSFMMLANGSLHLIAGILERNYVPGLITAVLLYIPYYLLLMIQLVRKKFLSLGTAIVLTLIGSVPMCIQGYRVLFLGTRLW